MANSDIFTFYPHFNEFLPVYRDVGSVWIGDGQNTGKSGMLYAQYATGEVVELGYVTLYNYAYENNYFTGSAAEWVQAILRLASTEKAATLTVTYQNSTNGTTHPASNSEGWTSTPSPEQGKYTWTKVVLGWVDSTTSEIYFVSYEGKDSAITSINGQTGAVTLHGDNLKISDNNNQTIKAYIDNLTPNVATTAEIQALFA